MFAFRRWARCSEPEPASGADGSAVASDSLSALAAGGSGGEAEGAPTLVAPEKWEIFTSQLAEVLQPQTFDGFRGIMQRQMTPLFVFQHHLILGSSEIPPLYQFGTIMATDVTSGSHFKADLDSTGGLMLSGLYCPTPALGLKVGARLAEDHAGKASDMLNLEASYKGDTFVSEATVNVSPDSKALVTRYLQSITPRITVGLAATYQGGIGALEWVARRDTPGHSRAQLHVSGPMYTMGYVRDVVPNRIAVGTELAVNSANPFVPQWSIAGQFKFKQSTVSTAVDVNGGVKTVIELKPNPKYNVNLSMDVNTFSDTYKVGASFMLNV